jgi:uncharacterized protein (DUF1786 family)
MSKVLSFDIGSGTLDVLLWDSQKEIENCIKMVLPSPNLLLREKVLQISSEKDEIVIDGYTVGGGKCAWTIKDLVKKGKIIKMTPPVARLVRDDLDKVKSFGIDIIEKPEQVDLFFQEIEFSYFDFLLRKVGEDFSQIDHFAFALQDHGVSPAGVSDRIFRFDLFLSFLEKDRSLLPFLFAFDSIPDVYSRMSSFRDSVYAQLGKNISAFMIDTSPAAIAGCFLDEKVASRLEKGKPVLFINFGNTHTMATIVKEYKISSLFEHHTRILKNAPQKIEYYLKSLSAGTLKTEEVFQDMGNGAIIYETFSLEDLGEIVVTGPNRKLITQTKLPFYYATPGGDMMMTGPLGIVSLLKQKGIIKTINK